MSQTPTSIALSIDSPTRAIAALVARARPAGVERVASREAGGRVLAQGVAMDRPSPACDVSSMDGYAVRLAELAAGRCVVAAEVRIGQPPIAAPSGGVARIVTGAAVPIGADAVIKREDVVEGEDRGAIEISAATLSGVRLGQNIRRRGENAGAVDVIAAAGEIVTPSIAGLLASVGAGEVDVRRRVRVGILVTGDELLAPGEAAADWRIRDSNGPTLAAMFMSASLAHLAEVVAVRRGVDEPTELASEMRVLLAAADVVIATGGVSAGDRDFIPGAVRESGGEVIFHKLPQRPGRPMLGAATAEGKIIMGLPGNPVSVMVTGRRIAATVVAAIAGAPERARGVEMVRVTNADELTLPLWWHRLARVRGDGEVELVGGKGSGDVVAAARSDGFVEVPPGTNLAAASEGTVAILAVVSGRTAGPAAT